MAAGRSAPLALAGGYRLAFLVAAAMVGLGLVLAPILLGRGGHGARVVEGSTEERAEPLVVELP
jgi:hypothetical protein